MKINLSTLPQQFIDGISTVKIMDNFKADNYTKSSVFIHKDNDYYYVVCGGTYMDKKGKFTMFKNKKFDSLEEAWNTFETYHNV